MWFRLECPCGVAGPYQQQKWWDRDSGWAAAARGWSLIAPYTPPPGPRPDGD